jgi:hypothetical protein
VIVWQSDALTRGGLVAEARAEDTDSDPRDASLERLLEAVRFVGGLAIALGAVPWSPGPNARI